MMVVDVAMLDAIIGFPIVWDKGNPKKTGTLTQLPLWQT